MSRGFAEYTNANFFSEDTVCSLYRVNDDTHNKHYFPYPNKNSTNLQAFIDDNIPAESVITEDRTSRNGILVKKTGTDGVAHLARAGALSKLWYTLFGEDETFYDSFDVDEVCFKDYAQKLIPRDVGYSKAMLDYFYRGKIKIEPVTTDSTLVDPRESTGIDGINPGTTVRKQTDAHGTYSFPPMFTMRGSKMWWGASCIFVNTEDEDAECGWNTLP